MIIWIFYSLRPMSTGSLITTAVSTRPGSEKHFRTPSVSCMLRAFSHRIAWKAIIVLMHQIHGLRTDISCRLPLMSFPFGMSQQDNARVWKRLTRRFHPALPQKPSRQISSTLDNIIDMVCAGISFFSTFSSEDVTGIQFHISTTADEEYP